MEPKSAPGPFWEGEISLGTPPGAPPEDHNEFFSAPEASGSDLGALREGQKKDFMLHSLFFSLPGSSGERFWSHFGSILSRFWEASGSHFEAIWERF